MELVDFDLRPYVLDEILRWLERWNVCAGIWMDFLAKPPVLAARVLMTKLPKPRKYTFSPPSKLSRTERMNASTVD